MDCKHENIKQIEINGTTSFKCMDCWDMWDWDEYKIYYSNRAVVHDYDERSFESVR